MSGNINVMFLFFIVLVVFIFKNRQKLYQTKLKMQENYENPSSLSTNFLEFGKGIQNKKIYTHEHDTLEYVPFLYTNYNYSLEYKLGYELSQIFKIRNKESLGLYQNLKMASENNRDIFVCSEVDYYHYLEKNIELKNNLNFICSLYYQHFLLFCQSSSKINSFLDLIRFRNKNNLPDNIKDTVIKVGIPSKETNSYQDALILFKSIGIDIKANYTNLKFIVEPEKKLLGRLKLNLSNPESIECLYLTTSNKNIYLLEFLNTGNLNVCTNEDINQNIIKSNYGGNYLFKQRLAKKNFSKIIKKKIYMKKYRIILFLLD